MSGYPPNIGASFEQFYPFGAQNALQSNFTSDVVITKAQPGILFEPTEASEVYQEFREVAGDLWLVSNASFTGAAWTQPTTPPCDFTKPAYALVMRANGSLQRLQGNATGSAVAAVVWNTLSTTDALGEQVITALALTAQANVLQSLAATWNAGGAVMTAMLLNIIDTSSAAGSKLQDLQVGGVSKWSVRKDGTLLTGTVPLANLPGAPQKGTVGGQACDGTLNTVVLPQAYATTIDQVFLTVRAGTLSYELGTPQVQGYSGTQFTYVIPGGQAGATVGIDYLVFGH